MIKQWAEAFGSNPMMIGVKICYDELKEKGYDFPQTASLKTIADQKPKAKSRPHPQSTSHVHPPGATSQGQIINPSPAQLTKFRKDLSVVNGNAKVFSEMLTELNPLQCDSNDYELMKELNRTCRAMQKTNC